MSAPDTNAYQNWWKNTVAAAVPWLAAGPNGQAEGAAWPAVLDYFIAQLVQARYQRFPDKCSPDALPHIGSDMWLVQGPNESVTSFQTRCKDPWGQWARAGQACGVLEQLWYYGLTNAYWVQQNGLYYTFNGQTLTPGQDPTSLLQFGDTTPLASTLTSIVEQVFAPPRTYRTISAGTPFISFDGNTDMCSRFAIILPSWPFASLAFATFSNSDNAAVTWPVPFPDNNYGTIVGPPNDNVVLNADGATATKTGITIRASAQWSGTVPVIAWEAGTNPFNLWSSASTGAAKALISAFRPNALCMGVYTYGTTKGAWGWPIRKWGSGDKWGQTNVIKILGGF